MVASQRSSPSLNERRTGIERQSLSRSVTSAGSAAVKRVRAALPRIAASQSFVNFRSG